MPLPDASRRVTTLFEELRDRHPLPRDKRWAHPVEHGALQLRPPRVPPRKDAVTARRTDSRARVSIGERHAFGAEPVEVRRRNLPARRIERTNVAVPEVVAEDVDNVGSW